MVSVCTRENILWDILKETGLLGAKPSSVPIGQYHGLAAHKRDLLQDANAYRRLVGKLIYLTITESICLSSKETTLGGSIDIGKVSQGCTRTRYLLC